MANFQYAKAAKFFEKSMRLYPLPGERTFLRTIGVLGKFRTLKFWTFQRCAECASIQDYIHILYS